MVGPNGAGKTTLLSILAGVQRPSAGSVSRAARARSAGRPSSRRSTRSSRSRRTCGLFARLEKVADPEAAVERMLEQTGLAERARERVERLSGGNRQRVNVALGLIADPPVLALDEPSSSLDPGQRERLWEFIGAAGRARHERGVLDPQSSARCSATPTRAIVLADGELLFDGSPADLIAASGRGEGGDFWRARSSRSWLSAATDALAAA